MLIQPLCFLLSLSFNSIVFAINFTQKSMCPSTGRLNLPCTSHDFCNKTSGLICGNGHCGYECPQDWKSLNNSCFKALPGPYSFFKAKSTCESYNAELAIVKTSDDIKALRDLLQFYNNFWLPALGSNFKEFTWSDGTILLNNDSLWANGEPNDLHKGEYCVFIAEYRYLYDSLCDSAYNCAAICQLDQICLNSKCKCKEDSYYDNLKHSCVKYQTINETCLTIDLKCNTEVGLSCSKNGMCICDDPKSYWNDITKKCEYCGMDQRRVDKKCYHINTYVGSLDTAIYSCNAIGMKLFQVSDNETRLDELINPFRTKNFITYPGVWVNGSKLVKNNELINHQLICNEKLNTFENDHCMFVDIKETDFCLNISKCYNNLYWICE